MRKAAEDFEDRELGLVYVARKLKDAMRLEEVFTAAGVDYAVEADRYWTGSLFRRERIGAFFYVVPETEDAAREIMRRNGFQPFASDQK